MSISISMRLATAVILACVALVDAGCGGTAEAARAAAERQLTVLLVEYEGPEAAASAERLAKELTSKGLPDVFAVEGAGRSSVCVGRYTSWKQPEADAMLKRVRVIRDAQGQYPFAGVMFVPVPEAVPATPWPLEKANGYFTLHVGSWEAPGRMVAAQAYAKELRGQGYEAYVYHGPRLSMVTVGAFGTEIFDDPAKVGKPGVKPRIVNPKVLALIQKFPRMRLEGEVAPPEAHVPTQLVQVPGREPPAFAAIRVPKVLYRVSLALVDVRTGLAEGTSRAAGVAQSKGELPTLVSVLAKQLLDSLPQDKTVRIGIVGILAMDKESAADKADALVLDSLTSALGRAVGYKADFVSPATTRQLLDGAGISADAVIRDTRYAKGAQGFSAVITGSVMAFPATGSQ